MPPDWHNYFRPLDQADSFTLTMRFLPSVDAILRQFEECQIPRPVIVRLVRTHLAQMRKSAQGRSSEEIVEEIRSKLSHIDASRLQLILNGTGVLLHTNLGRSPLPQRVCDGIEEIAPY